MKFAGVYREPMGIAAVILGVLGAQPVSAPAKEPAKADAPKIDVPAPS